MDGDNVVEKSAMVWLVLAYLFHTIGELCASPVALSFITKLAPVKYAAFMMGAYFAATGLGNKVAGFVGGMSEGAGEFQVFSGIAIFLYSFWNTNFSNSKTSKAFNTWSGRYRTTI